MKQIVLSIFLLQSFLLFSQKKYEINGNNYSEKYFNEVLAKITENDALLIQNLLIKNTSVLEFNNIDVAELTLLNININSIRIKESKIKELYFSSVKLNNTFIEDNSFGKVNISYTEIDFFLYSSDTDAFYYNGNLYKGTMSFSLSGTFNKLYVSNIEYQNITIDSCVFEISDDIYPSVDFYFIKTNELFFSNNQFRSFYSIRKDTIGGKIVSDTLKGSALFLSGIEAKSIYFSDNKFISLGDTIVSSLDIYDSSIDNLVIRDTVDVLNIVNSSINNSFTLDEKFVLNNFFIINNVKLPKAGLDFDWSKLSKKLIVTNNFYGGIKVRDIDTLKFLGYNNYELINNGVLYRRYISSLSSINNIYREMGIQYAANQTYVEIKEAETAYYKHVFKTQGGFENRLSYYLNLFLKYFAEYGTKPVRAIQISMWVILIFACFYFFTYSNWDKINRQFFMEKSNQMIKYFTSEQKLEDFYSESYKEDMLSYEAFKKNLKEKRSEVPFFFVLLMKPLYYLSIIKHKLNAWMYRRVEILKGRWVDLKRWKKFTVGTTVFIWSIVYLAYLAAIRGLNSMVLSINTFSTLGFGDIPVRGLARYVAILEGFLGWFLLTIFSVSLISQILQN
ncbi:MAG: ion channel [Bacteroidia bacterium]